MILPETSINVQKAWENCLIDIDSKITLMLAKIFENSIKNLDKFWSETENELKSQIKLQIFLEKETNKIKMISNFEEIVQIGSHELIENFSSNLGKYVSILDRVEGKESKKNLFDPNFDNFLQTSKNLIDYKIGHIFGVLEGHVKSWEYFDCIFSLDEELRISNNKENSITSDKILLEKNFKSIYEDFDSTFLAFISIFILMQLPK